MDQITEACVLTPSVDEDERVEMPTKCEAFAHFVTFPFKLLFAVLIPPTHIMNGWLAFLISFAVIGGLVIIIADLSLVLECTLNVKQSVTALTILSIGFSLPELFTTAMAAKYESTADAAIGHVCLANAVNFFLGIGLPWVLATGYTNDHHGI